MRHLWFASLRHRLEYGKQKVTVQKVYVLAETREEATKMLEQHYAYRGPESTQVNEEPTDDETIYSRIIGVGWSYEAPTEAERRERKEGAK